MARSSLAAPAQPALAAVAGGSLAAGTIYVRVTACTQNTETAPSPEASVAVAANQAVSMNVPAVAGAQWYSVYAAAAAGQERWMGFTTLTGPGAFTLASLVPQVGLDGGMAANQGLEPLVLSDPLATGPCWWLESVEFPVGWWPPRYLAFEEQQGVFVLVDDPKKIPYDPSQVLNTIYAAAHQLDPSGTSLPDKDWDTVALGAAGFACLWWGLPLSDNFVYQDGEVRDRVDDSMVPRAWRDAGQARLLVFRERLENIRLNRRWTTTAAQRRTRFTRWDPLIGGQFPEGQGGILGTGQGLFGWW